MQRPIGVGISRYRSVRWGNRKNLDGGTPYQVWVAQKKRPRGFWGLGGFRATAELYHTCTACLDFGRFVKAPRKSRVFGVGAAPCGKSRGIVAHLHGKRPVFDRRVSTERDVSVDEAELGGLGVPDTGRFICGRGSSVRGACACVRTASRGAGEETSGRCSVGESVRPSVSPRPGCTPSSPGESTEASPGERPAKGLLESVRRSSDATTTKAVLVSSGRVSDQRERRSLLGATNGSGLDIRDSGIPRIPYFPGLFSLS